MRPLSVVPCSRYSCALLSATSSGGHPCDDAWRQPWQAVLAAGRNCYEGGAQLHALRKTHELVQEIFVDLGTHPVWDTAVLIQCIVQIN